MKQAARVGDTTSHGGVIIGPGNPTVLIEGSPAATLGDQHNCPLGATGQHSAVGPFITVLIGGKPALRQGDSSSCGAVLIGGSGTVLIG